MSKKDYKKGMADAVEAYKGFGEKQEAAIRHVGQEVEKTAQKVDKLGDKIGEITDYITDQEKASLYKLNTPVDIADLEDAEKRILMAVLYQLSADADEVTEEQQNYVRAVQQYLKIYNPQTEIDLSAVENIEDISTQKAVLQASLEFFRLGTHLAELTDEQEDFLDCFQVNRKTRREISGYIDAIVETVGIQGLSEKYGFVAAQPRSEFARYKDNGPIPEKVVDFCMEQFNKFCKIEHRTQMENFQNRHFFLETKNYLVWCKSPGRMNTYIEDGFAAGFYRIDKQTAKMEHIDIDYTKDFPFDFVEYLSFFIQGNTIFFIENYLSGHSDRKPELVAVDFAKKSCRILPFAPSMCKYQTYFHLSGDASQLVVHMQMLGEYLDRIERTATYAIDLIQNDRIFTLEPKMKRIYDAFLYNGKYLFLGEISDNDYTIYQYTPENGTLVDIVNSEQNSRHNIYTALINLIGGSFQNVTIEWMDYRNEKFYFLLGQNAYREKARKYYLSIVDPQTHKGEQPFSFLTCNIFFYGDSIFCTEFGKLYDLNRGDLTTCSVCGDGLILLGDFLCGGTSKTNISNGWDNLQWEIMSFPE